MEGLEVFEKIGSGYLYKVTANGHNIEARVSRVQETGDRLKAEIGILFNGSPIVRSNPVLTSVSGMDAFWRKLARRLPQSDWGIDWEQLVENLGARVTDSHREGEPEIVISDIVIPETVQWQIEPMLLKDQPNIIFGPGGSGKSTFALWLAVLMDSGHVDTSHDLTVLGGKVLYLDWETDSVEIAARVRDLQAGMGLDRKPGILYRRCTQSLAVESDMLKTIVEQRNISMVIVDSLGLATGGGLDEAESVLEYFTALRYIGGTSLTITHTNKENLIFGSVYTVNCGRSIWEVTKSGGEGDAKNLDLGLFHRKVNIVGKQKPRAYSMAFSENSITLSVKDVIDTELSGRLSVSELVYQIVLKQGPVKTEELPEMVAEHLNVQPEKIHNAVKQAVHRFRKNNKMAVDGGEIMIAVQPKLIEGEDKWEAF